MTDYRKSSRQSVFLPVSISAMHNGDDSIGNTVTGRILNISNHGACILMPKVIVDQFHFFHSLQGENAGALKLYILDNGTDALKITAQPIWFDTVQLDDTKIFKIGINFNDNLDNSAILRMSTA